MKKDMTVLIVEDNSSIANNLARAMQSQGFKADIAADSQVALDLINTGNYNVIIMDRMIPGPYDGVELISFLRKNNNKVPILMLTALASINSKTSGLDAGADDYLAKPFDLSELYARIRAIMRRSSDVLSSIIDIKTLHIDNTNKIATINGITIDLSKKEFELLTYLAQNNERYINKDELIENVWDFDSEILPNTVEVFINGIRKKINKINPKAKDLIATKRGFGYKIT
jgi:DNA-binding response OmpR family regulator